MAQLDVVSLRCVPVHLSRSMADISFSLAPHAPLALVLCPLRRSVGAPGRISRHTSSEALVALCRTLCATAFSACLRFPLRSFWWLLRRAADVQFRLFVPLSCVLQRPLLRMRPLRTLLPMTFAWCKVCLSVLLPYIVLDFPGLDSHLPSETC